MEREKVIQELRVILQQEQFTATRIGAPGCQIRRVAAENVRALEAAIALLRADGEQ